MASLSLWRNGVDRRFVRTGRPLTKMMMMMPERGGWDSTSGCCGCLQTYKMEANEAQWTDAPHAVSAVESMDPAAEASWQKCRNNLNLSVTHTNKHEWGRIEIKKEKTGRRERRTENAKEKSFLTQDRVLRSSDPPCTWAGLRSCLKRRRNLTPWLSPDFELTKTNSGEQPWGRTASQASSVPEWFDKEIR